VAFVFLVVKLSLRSTIACMSPLGPLLDEPPEPMTREQFLAIRKRLKDSWNGSVTLAKNDAQRLLDEIVWLKRRLQRVEYVIEPLVESLRPDS
jgi:hypothetical protein